MARNSKLSHDAIDREQAEAWIGDAVLALAVRKWILRTRDGRVDGEAFARLTSNQFLSAWGQPTAVEARIGRLYAERGLDGVTEFVESEMVPLFWKQQRNRCR